MAESQLPVLQDFLVMDLQEEYYLLLYDQAEFSCLMHHPLILRDDLLLLLLEENLVY
jgi:hypothetical protein